MKAVATVDTMTPDALRPSRCRIAQVCRLPVFASSSKRPSTVIATHRLEEIRRQHGLAVVGEQLAAIRPSSEVPVQKSAALLPVDERSQELLVHGQRI